MSRRRTKANREHAEIGLEASDPAWVLTPLSLCNTPIEEIEGMLRAELSVLSEVEQVELRRKCQAALEEWRSCQVAQVPNEEPHGENAGGDRLLTSATKSVLDDAFDGPHNQIVLGLKLYLDNYELLRLLGFTYGERCVLACLALDHAAQDRRARALVQGLILICKSYQQVLNFKPADAIARQRELGLRVEEIFALNKETMKRVAENREEDRKAVALIGPLALARAKQLGALAGNRADGSRANKLRGDENRRVWRQMAKDVLRQHPHRQIRELVQHIRGTGYGQKEDGTPYGDGTIRNALKGVCREWREEQRKNDSVQPRPSKY